MIYRSLIVIGWVLAIGYIVSVAALAVVIFYIIYEEFFKGRPKK